MSPFPTKTEAFVLTLLMSKLQMYGLELVAASGGKLKRGTVYVLLDRLEDKGLIESVAAKEKDGRRLYKISAQGVRVMQIGDRKEHLGLSPFFVGA